MDASSLRGTMILRFSRFRFKDGAEAEGTRILESHAAAIRASPGCVDVWIGRGQHPSTEVVVVALFQDEGSFRSFEGRLRSDPRLGGDVFSLLRLTTKPPEMTQYEVK